MVNRLAGAASPYLRQHADNPVDWHLWGDEAFREARRRDVPVLLSVGYSACHWCHVMAHESFEDDEVAALMNELFVCIKVDREERPDVDALYMDAVQALTGRGGWPMTVFMDPTGRPFFGGTYYPRSSFISLLSAVDDAWRNKREELDHNATVLVETINASSALEPLESDPGYDLVNRALATITKAYDPDWGGFGTAPKFPQTFHLELVLRAYLSSGSADARALITNSLDAMASGGIYDHIGGGFARYSVDQRWMVPHFEKMLYDQALLVRIYLHAAVVFGEPRWLEVVTETIEYVLHDLGHRSGGWYSAEDADSADADGAMHEGRFYTWTPEEVAAILGDTAPAACEWWDITEEGNFEGRSIPNRAGTRGEWTRPAERERDRRALLAARSQRPRPGLDDKILTEWNALFLTALVEAAMITDNARWLAAATATGEFLYRELRSSDGRWYRSWHASAEPRASHAALAADHAALVDAFTRLAEATGSARWIDAAVEVADTMLDHFWDASLGGLFTVPDDGDVLVVRQKEFHDGATPSANSSATIALIRLAGLTGEPRYAHHADQILRLQARVLQENPTSATNALAAVDLRRRGLIEVAVVGDRPDLVRVAQSLWSPYLVLAWGEPYGSPLWSDRRDGFAYVCRDYHCELPQDTAEGLFRQLTGRGDSPAATSDPDG